MENGIADIHRITHPPEVSTIKIIDTSYCSSVNASNNTSCLNHERTPTPPKRVSEFRFIDDGNASSSSASSSATSTKERVRQSATSVPFQQDERDHHSDAESTAGSSVITLQGSSPPSSMTLTIPPSSPSPPHSHLMEPDIYEMTPAPTRRLPTVVVLGYQRAVAESQAAAERLQQQQKTHNQRSLTLTAGDTGGCLIDHGVSPSPHGRNNRVSNLAFFL